MAQLALAEAAKGSKPDAASPTNLPAWRSIASVPLNEIDVAFWLKGSTATLQADLATISAYYQAKPPDPQLRNSLAQKNQTTDDVQRAKEMLEDRYRYGNYPSVAITDLDASWSQDAAHDRSWNWLHHQLVALRYLMRADAQSGQAGHSPYFERAERLTRSWAAHNYQTPSPSAMSWHDHGTAYRLRNLMLFFEQARTHNGDPELLGLLLRMIRTHAEILTDDTFYSKRTNHGFDQMMILYWMSAIFPEMEQAQRLHELSWQRLDDEIGFMFTESGAHVENSPGYHLSVLTTLDYLGQICATHDDQIHFQGISAISDKAWEFMAASVTPEGKLALVGDTVEDQFPSLELDSQRPSVATFHYAITQGREGQLPKDPDRVYPEAGYAMFRDAWHGSKTFAESIYVYFKSGFLSQYHRQDDDLHLLLYGYGEAWLIDSGRYNYEERTPMRIYMRSARAHNTIVPDGESTPQRRLARLTAGTGITTHTLGREGSRVTGRTTVYDGLILERELVYTRPATITLRDRVAPAKQGGEVPGFSLMFHLPNDKRIKLNPSGFEATGPSGARMILNSTPTPTAVEIISGVKEPEVQGWTSRQQNQLESSQCIVLEYPAGQATAETMITLLAPGQAAP